MFRRSASAVIALLALAVAGCGGSSSPLTSPGPPPAVTPTDACGAIGGARQGAASIVNGAECSQGNSAVVLINLRSQERVAVGACSGTIIAPRAVLTGAHCLDEDVAIARVWLGPPGPEIVAASFVYYPGYGPGSSLPDVGILRMSEDLRPAPVPLLTSRDARVGETAVIAGWGRDQNSVPATLRAGTAVISSVGPQLLETAFTSNASSICSGDSGGPILLSEGGSWSVAGVISATSTAGCTTGTAFYVNLRNPNAQAFILSQVPEAARR